ncbi:MerR family transcriptional regulator [Nocardiopsis sp. HNM0947]|uniref:MerR family transcriptional regulator n=1 Tax=Nocardiopsis coralli TaxID=2772213 RepID=A0ABR9P3H6_9ACTN|nr:MerR family transcriptional regulator [Nocardiopsis coralli]MBE2998406.1 MerR family transcriptional regulator [Nocardiopsis coralli]
MLSSELAELAGVTVRTLRHYHRIGLLPEPPRSSGGYRRYGVSDLVRLLRITRMTALGLPLSALPEVLDDPTAAEELLDELDRRAAAEIERLTARRADIAALRRGNTPPDLPPGWSGWRTDPEKISADMARYEHEQLVLAGHLLGHGGPALLTALVGESAPDSAVNVALTERFYALGPDTPDVEVAALVDELVTHLEPVVAGLTELPPLDHRASALMEQLNEQALEPVQHRVLQQVQQRLAATGEGSGGG